MQHLSGDALLDLLAVAVGLTGLFQLRSADQRLDAMYEQNVQAIARLGEARADVQQVHALSRRRDPAQETKEAIAALEFAKGLWLEDVIRVTGQIAHRPEALHY